MEEIEQDSLSKSQESDSILRCIRCNTELLVQSIRPEQKIRCAMCSSIQDSKSVPKSRGTRGMARLTTGEYRIAWWSLTLGIASIFFIFLTGIPSIYYGMRSFLKMKYIKPTNGERYAAGVGTAFGVVFGLFWGGCISIAGGLVLALYLTNIEGVGETESQAILDAKFNIQVVDEVKPYQARKLLNSRTHINFSDAPYDDQQDRNVYLRLVHVTSPMQINRTQLRSEIRDRVLRNSWTTKTIHKESLDWNICGEPREVAFKRQAIFEDADPPPPSTEELHRYETVFSVGNHSVGILFIFKTSDYDFTVDEVRQMFESISVVE